MMNDLPSSMRTAVTFDMNHKLLFQHKIFSLNFSPEFLNKLSLYMKTLRVGPEIRLFQPKDFDQRVYFILKGSIDIFYTLNHSPKSCKILKVSSFFTE